MRTRPRGDVRPAVAVQVLFVLYGVVIAAFFPFIALFLSERGLSASRIGVVIASMAVARIAAAPVWGHVADASLGRRTTLQIGLLGTAGAAVGLFLVERDAATVALSFVFAAFSSTTGPNADAIALGHLGRDRMNEYGRIRGWESLGYAVSCLLIGLTLEFTNPSWTMPICAGGSIAVCLWSFTLRHDRPARSDHGRLGTVGAVFREAPRFWRFLLALLLVWTGFHGAWNFIALKIEQGGGGPLLVGVGAALGGLVEVPVMRLSARLGRSWGLRRVFCLGCAVYATGFVLWGVIESPTVVSLLTVLEGIGFGLLFSSSVVVIGKMLPASLHSTGQSMAVTMSLGIAPIVGAGVGGFVFDSFGTVALYVGASALALAGGAAAWIALSEPAVANPDLEVEPIL